MKIGLGGKRKRLIYQTFLAPRRRMYRALQVRYVTKGKRESPWNQMRSQIKDLIEIYLEKRYPGNISWAPRPRSKSWRFLIYPKCHPEVRFSVERSISFWISILLVTECLFWANFFLDFFFIVRKKKSKRVAKDILFLTSFFYSLFDATWWVS